MDAEAASSQDSYRIEKVYGTELKGSFRNLILAKFLRTLKSGNYYFKLADSESYFSNYHVYIKSIFLRPNVVANFAVLDDSPDVVLGWSLTENDSILHYVWVDAVQRNKGIAKSLCPNQISKVTHLTTIGAKIFKDMKNVSFDPWG